MKTLIITSVFAMVAGAALVGSAGCSSDGDKNSSSSSSGYVDHSSPYPDCDAIIKACHPYDVGEGTVHDCHDQGHEATSNDKCAPVKEMCLKACQEAAAAAGADGGTTNAGDAGDGGSL